LVNNWSQQEWSLNTASYLIQGFLIQVPLYVWFVFSEDVFVFSCQLVGPSIGYGQGVHTVMVSL
jgi:hypothetical protein